MVLCSILSVSAKDFGTLGEIFPIREKNLLQLIQSKLKAIEDSGQMARHQKEIVQRTEKRIRRPDPVAGIHKTVTPREFLYDPSLTVPYDLKDHRGQLIHAQGTKVNPLETHQLRSPLIFVDGDDTEQLAWAIGEFKAASELNKPKIILVKGAPLDLSNEWDLPIYFDQGGAIVAKLGIAQVPAKVSQKENLLLVQELDLANEKEKK